MAEIYGVTLKNVKKFRGLEGEGFSATIYIDGKKAGFAVDSATGGEIDIEADKPMADILEAKAKAYFAHYPDYKNFDDYYKNHGRSIDLIEEILHLQWVEKNYKKSAKAGYPVSVEVRYNTRITPLEKHDFKKQDFLTCLKEWNFNIERMLIDKYKPVEFQVYEKEEDFNIKEA